LVNILQWGLGLLILATSVMSAVFSYRARRSQEPKVRGLNAARMNICMGLMLIFIALIQMTMFSGSSVRVIVGALFMVIGLFNLFSGLRSHSFLTRTR
jgi:hypothetical protein